MGVEESRVKRRFVVEPLVTHTSDETLIDSLLY